MTIGEKTLSPLCELRIFADRKESCFRNGAIEMRDRTSVVLLAILALMFVISMKFKYIQQKILEQNLLTSAIDKIAFVVIISGIAARDYYPSFKDQTLNEFSGLGFDVATIAALLAFVAVYWPRNEVEPIWVSIIFRGKSRIFTSLAISIFIFSFLPAILLFRSNINWGDITTHVFNELLAPAAGVFPLSDSIPQYTSLLGLPILAVSKLFGSKVAVLIVPLWISLLSFGILLIMTFIFTRLFPRTPKTTALLVICAVLLARSSDSSFAYTLASFPSWTVRLVLPTLSALLLHTSLARNSNKLIVPSALGLGVATSLAFLNNFEFGFSCAISIIFTVTTLIMFRKIAWSFFLNVLVGVMAVIALLFSFYSFNNETVNLNFSVTISKEFGAKGFLSWPMPNFGFFVVIYCIAGIALIQSSLRFRDLSLKHKYQSDNNLLADVSLAIFGGIWTLASTLFYSARSVDGNLRVIFLPAVIAALATFKLIQRSSTGGLYSKVFKSAALPTAVIVLLPFALVIKAPDPYSTWSRVIEHDKNEKWTWESIANKPVARTYLELTKLGYDKIGLMSSEGNAISIVTGGENILAVNALADLAISAEINRLICVKLSLSGVNHVLTEGKYEQNFPCDGMTNPKILANGSVTLLDYKSPSQG